MVYPERKFPTFLAWNDTLLRKRQEDEINKNIFGMGGLVVQAIDNHPSNGDLNQDIEQQHVPDAEHHAIEAGAEENIAQMKHHKNKTDAINEAINEADAEEDITQKVSINEANAVDGRREKKHKRSQRKKKRSHKKYSDTDSGAEDLEEVSKIQLTCITVSLSNHHTKYNYCFFHVT